jgi:3-oxoacyl-[acyl-carrier protein] reductase
MRPTNYFKKEYQETMEKMFPLGRYAKTEDIAYSVVYLASDESAFVTGQVL